MTKIKTKFYPLILGMVLFLGGCATPERSDRRSQEVETRLSQTQASLPGTAPVAPGKPQAGFDQDPGASRNN